MATALQTGGRQRPVLIWYKDAWAAHPHFIESELDEPLVDFEKLVVVPRWPSVAIHQRTTLAKPIRTASLVGRWRQARAGEPAPSLHHRPRVVFFALGRRFGSISGNSLTAVSANMPGSMSGPIGAVSCGSGSRSGYLEPLGRADPKLEVAAVLRMLPVPGLPRPSGNPRG